MAAKRDFSEPVALNWTQDGTDVDFGSLSRQLIGFGAQHGMATLFGHEVRNLRQESDGSWTVKVAQPPYRRRSARSTPSSSSSARAAARCRCCRSRASRRPRASAASRSAASCCAPAIRALAAAHQAKVYGQPPLGAPPMSVPHLDTRVINGRSWLLFGPFAGWSPKFLKQGKVTDLPFSVKPNNLVSMLGVGLTEMGLVKYLVGQLLPQRGRPGRRTARVRAQRSRFRLGARRRGAARPGDPHARARVACSSSAPPCSRRPTAASPVCSARRRVRRRRCPPCST